MVEIYLNETVGSMLLQYHPDAVFRCAYRGAIKWDPEPEQEVSLDLLWALFNREPRALGSYKLAAGLSPEDVMNNYAERSLSVGDVVTLDEKKSFAVEPVGFRELNILMTGERVMTYEQWKAERGSGRPSLPGWPELEDS